MRTLSKSKLIAFRQCPKRLWLEIHRRELLHYGADTQARFATGHEVGEIARKHFDPKGKGVLLDAQKDGFEQALSRTAELLNGAQPIFEAGFKAAGGIAFADVLLPVKRGGQRQWRMLEVKSSTSVKDYHTEDVAIQAFIAQKAGARLASVSLVHIDSTWTYAGDGDYGGLLAEADLSSEAFALAPQVAAWMDAAQQVAARPKAPQMRTGSHCEAPFSCGFIEHCESGEPQAQYPVKWLSGTRSKAFNSLIEAESALDMRGVPDEVLNKTQLHIKTRTLANEDWFDAEGAASDLAPYRLPAYFLDFETIQFAVPRWAGTRPYRQIPFQFSVHRLTRTGRLAHEPFLDLSGTDPSRGCAKALIDACGDRGAVFVYNAGFERARIEELASRYPRLKNALLAITERLVDLLPIAKARYYSPSQQGSWSIKAVLPAIAPDLRYDTLDGVQHGAHAMQAYLEAIDPDTAPVRKREIETQLLAYCRLDTFAMVRLWQFFAGRNDMKIVD